MRDLLIVEDEPDVAELLRLTLSSDDISVRIATSGEEGVALALARTPDLVLLDVSLPGMDGMEVCEVLRAQASTMATPIAFLTARASSDDIRRGLRAGGTTYLLKPFDPDLLRETIVRLLDLTSAAAA